MKLIDTNIFLEILLKQTKSEIAKQVLRDLNETLEPFIVTSFTIHSIIVILENRKQLKELQIFINSLSEFGNLIFYCLDFDEVSEIVNNLSQWKLDFDDAFQYFVAKKMDAEIITFD
ncbi:MAG: PIN domain-containing protein, partial [candidate division KSB1 bacterium]|nr:PIN domain-containing protein [candidate division KSB1 bacterium]